MRAILFLRRRRHATIVIAFILMHICLDMCCIIVGILLITYPQRPILDQIITKKGAHLVKKNLIIGVLGFDFITIGNHFAAILQPHARSEVALGAVNIMTLRLKARNPGSPLRPPSISWGQIHNAPRATELVSYGAACKIIPLKILLLFLLGKCLLQLLLLGLPFGTLDLFLPPLVLLSQLL
jgi:hypothetical protein